MTLIMTLTLDLQGQILNLLYISQKRPIARKQKTNLSKEYWALNVTIHFGLDHDLDLEF